LLFLYREVLGVELPWLDGVQKAKAQLRLPVVLSHEEVARLLARLEGVHRLIGSLLYGTGLRIMEAMRLRVKDVEFARREILVRDGKGNKDRVTMLPVRLVAPLQAQIDHARELHRGDLAHGGGDVWLPFALDRKYPGAAREWCWQYVFPGRRDPIHRSARRRCAAPSPHRPGIPARDEKRSRGAHIEKPATPHSLRQSFATHLFESGYDIRTVQGCWGTRTSARRMIYTHVLNRGGRVS
jgi:integron integrase